MSKDFNIYGSYTAEDYLEDQDFRNWVLQPQPGNNEWWQEVITRYPDQEKVAEQARMLLLEMENHFQPAELRNEALDESFIANLKQEMGNAQNATVVSLNRRKFIRRFAVAASILFMLGTVSWFWVSNPGQMQTIATDYGEWKTYTLPDGSEIKLNANSGISFAKYWESGADRKVWLTGEAFFEVSKDPEGAKFTVITEDLEVEVLGTAFNVHSRGEETGVFLQEGKVRLDLGAEEQVMVPGEFIAYSAHQKKITEHKKVVAESHTSWKEGSLIMEDETVKMILEKMEEIYGYEVKVNRQNLLDIRKTVAIPMDKIEIAIPILERTLGMEIYLQNDLLIVK